MKSRMWIGACPFPNIHTLALYNLRPLQSNRSYMKLAPFAVALALATCICFAADPPKDTKTPSANAAKAPPPKASINEADADQDFKIQGEYLGEAGDLKLGIQ